MSDEIAEETTVEPRIVEAVGTAVNSEDAGLAEELEAAMSLAVLQAMEDGVSLDNSKEILARKNAAREQVLAERELRSLKTKKEDA